MLLDVKTRLEELGAEPYRECHLTILKEMAMILEPVEVGVNELSKREQIC